ncbi:MAG: helix-turn-helix domain-containing protein [Patescibacteria group bacterium]
MELHLPVDDLELLSIKEAVRVTEYTRDYLTRLAREGKIAAAYLDRQWYVSLPSLRAYAEQAAIEQEVRKRQLSLARQRERDYHALVAAVRAQQQQRAESFSRRASWSVVAVMGLGLMVGLWGYQIAGSTLVAPGFSGAQLASVGEITRLSQGADQSSRSVMPLAYAEEGLLLLPQQATSAAPSAYFSDPVAVELVGDQTYVRLRDSSGSTTLRRVPFVTVPVEVAPVGANTDASDHSYASP